MLAVFLTYNSVGWETENGKHVWGANVALVTQGFIRKQFSGTDLEEKQTVLGSLWERTKYMLTQEGFDLADIDYWVINCGKLPDVVIGMISEVHPKRVKLVHCGCGHLLENDRFSEAGYIYTACGGINTMQRILEEYLSTGEIVSYMTYAEALLPKGV